MDGPEEMVVMMHELCGRQDPIVFERVGPGLVLYPKKIADAKRS